MHRKTKVWAMLYVFFIFFWAGADAKEDTLAVLHISDIHICNLTGYHPDFVKGRQHYGEGVPSFREFLDTVPRSMGADAVVITGDLVDFYEAETEKGPTLGTQIEQLGPMLTHGPVPLFLTLGNHDLGSYWIEKNDRSIKSFQYHAHESRAAWIRNLPCFQEGTYYARQFIVGKTTYRFLFLDNGYSLKNDFLLDPSQLDWLYHQLQTAADDPVILFMHKYLPVPDLNGDGKVFTEKSTFMINTETCSRGFLNALNGNKNVRALFVGHGHESVSELLSFPAGHQILQTETAAFAKDRHNWRLLQFTENEIIVHSTGERKIELKQPVK